MVISDDAPAAPTGPAMGILLKGIGAGAVLGTACGAFLTLATGAGAPTLLPLGALFGLATGMTLGFLCSVVGLGLHEFAERHAPVLDILPLQQLALALALARGEDPDSPRGLHKVTSTR